MRCCHHKPEKQAGYLRPGKPNYTMKSLRKRGENFTTMAFSIFIYIYADICNQHKSQEQDPNLNCLKKTDSNYYQNWTISTDAMDVKPLTSTINGFNESI